MSHFIVMVIGEDIEGILEPYNEGMEVMEHMDRTKEQIHKEFIDFQGSLVAENKPKSVLTPFEQLTLSLDKETDTWSVGWCGQHLDADGNTLSTYNPDSKWDWFQVGGRWSGTLILKPGREGSLGQRSWTNEEEKIPENRVDGAYNKDIDWDAMNEIAKKQMADAWDELFDPNPDHCHYRPEYVEKQRKLHLELYGTKEEYIKRRGIWTPYAYVTEDGWFAPGDMGYWGMSSDETKDRDEFDIAFKKFVAELHPKDVVTIVDCHI